MKNVVLIGLPGSGKTTVGQLLAQKLRRPFVDTDVRVEEKAGRPIPEIFSLSGEEVFRRMETTVLLAALHGTAQVIATGGGIVLRQTNREALRAAYVFFLDRTVEEITSTCSLTGRPLLRKNTLSALAHERRQYYLRCADCSVTGASPEEMVSAIMKRGKDECIF